MPSRNEQIARFYSQQQHRLHATVRARVNAPTHVIEDAIQTAWTKLIERPDVTLDQRGANWLATVAIHQGWNHAATRASPAGALTTSPEPGERTEPVSPTPGPAEQAIASETHQQRVAALQRLKPREQRELLLYAAGYSYTDIAKLTGSTYTAINRRLAEGRAALRARKQQV